MAGETRSDDPVLAELVAKCLDRREAGEDDALESLCRDHPSHATALRRRIALLEQVGLVGTRANESPGRDSEADPRARDFPERLGDFRLLRRVGGGGMGVVYLARQDSLGRDVALKLIRPESAYFGGAKQRFRREVEAVARLNHAGIVPIYTVGEENGIPFFAMEFVEGTSFSELIAALRERGDASRLSGKDLAAVLLSAEPDRPSVVELGERLGPTWVQSCVRLGLEVAEALAHAHARGVIHRDVKPSNILVTREGRARLADFGLASFGADHSLTQSTSPLGSPPYMAPEVCAGGGAAADARTDVYALGVTLYELLSLKMAFSGDSREILARILGGDCTPLREVNANVPRDVEAVVQKAMDLDQDRRYPTADALATDLRNVLELRPVLATRPGWLLRTRRFVQRRPALAMAALLVFFLTVVFPLAYSQVLEIKNREIAAQQEVARRHRDATLEALDTILDAVSRTDLPDVPAVTNYRLAVLTEAERVIESLGEEARTRGDAFAQRLRIESSAASLASRLGRVDEVEERTTRLIAQIERGSWRESPSSRAELARLRTLRAGARTGLARTAEAKDDALAALAIWREFFSVSTPPRGLIEDYLHTLAMVRPIATLDADREFAELLDREAEAVESRAVELFPDDQVFAFARLERIVATGVAAAYAGREDEVGPALAEAMAIYSRLPDDPEYSRSAPRMLAGLAELHAFTGDFETALKTVTAGARAAAELAATHPDRPAYRYDRARSLSIAASYEQRLARLRPDSRPARDIAARKALVEALEIFRGLGAFLEQDVAASSDYAAALGLLADLELDAGEPARAEELVAESLARLERQLSANPLNWSNRANQAKTYELLAFAQRDGGRIDDAIRSLERARALLAETKSLNLVAPALVDTFVADNLLITARVLGRADRFAAALDVVADLRAVANRPRDRLEALAFLGATIERVEADSESARRTVSLALDFLDPALGNSEEMTRIRLDSRIAPLRLDPGYAAAESRESR